MLPDNKGLLSLAMFAKTIRDDIFAFANQELVDGITYQVTEPRNAEHSSLRGVEAGMVIDRLDFISSYLGNFGVRANATYVDGEMHYRIGTTEYKLGRLQSQSKWSGDAALFYNSGPGEVRFEANYQGGYLDEFGTQPWQNLGWRGFMTYDLTGNYNITNQLEIRAEARNLTDSNRRHVTGMQLKDFFEDVEFGRSFFLIATYSLDSH
jgi:outer membrane receptor protein involved in Fe transport